MKIGDWVFFKTRNWPKGSVTGKAEHVTDERLYSGRGTIVGIVGKNYTVCEEQSHRLDDIPVTIVLPLSFFSDLDDTLPDHPEFKAVSECQSVEACGISITDFTEDGDFTDRYIPPAEREEEDWDFSVEMTPHPEQCFKALRRTENE